MKKISIFENKRMVRAKCRGFVLFTDDMIALERIVKKHKISLGEAVRLIVHNWLLNHEVEK